MTTAKVKREKLAPRSVAFAGAVWRVGSPTCLIPVENPEDPDVGFWEEVPVVTCKDCHQLAPASPCADCTVEAERQDCEPRTCEVCGREYRNAFTWYRTCSTKCSTLKANSHNSSHKYA